MAAKLATGMGLCLCESLLDSTLTVSGPADFSPSRSARERAGLSRSGYSTSTRCSDGTIATT